MRHETILSLFLAQLQLRVPASKQGAKQGKGLVEEAQTAV
jgi:hypothetical protein